ncbi:ubiquitin-protein ligase PSH1 KNAG_0G03280 [Huiozyma naganishii CBS 8797]|uniref:RING-type domain-containing protein n=1 Tax=Huiozyma naganishii (strain ATCC MYA-139 / BCRC 22969 / CBS 8797 / KCTC 17520 / NBRC 10181 / NCYC 3082 / Yp74L-3) TaxID=1071383 RepID=J7S991_HUIN7|nr:hypothetical protein KNAG_0G03280 [Kazachstania naganishii CBS 8797]CCK71386.1 hypothetical protein KNAG_0G03280 [Kazachstania naganishii CBS 8797]
MTRVKPICDALGKKRFKKVCENLLECCVCTICHELMSVPMMVECGHNYCYTCLKHWLTSNENTVLKCPDCRSVVSHPPNMNMFLDHQLKYILEMLVKNAAPDSEWVAILAQRDNDMTAYRRDATSKNLFDGVFVNSTLAVTDMDDDGIPRCGNCHWELDPDDVDDDGDDNVCPHCHFRIRNVIRPSRDTEGTGVPPALADDYSEGEYESITVEMQRGGNQRASESDYESGSSEDRPRGSVYDLEAQDSGSGDEPHDDEMDSDLDSFIENDEEETDGPGSNDNDSTLGRRKRVYAVLDADESDSQQSSPDSDFYEHNSADEFVSGDSLDEQSPDPTGRRRGPRVALVLSDDE